MNNYKLMAILASLVTGGLGFILASGYSDAASDNGVDINVSDIPIWWYGLLAILVILALLCLWLWAKKKEKQ